MNLNLKRKMMYNKPELEYIEMHKIILCNSYIDGGVSTAGFDLVNNYEEGME